MTCLLLLSKAIYLGLGSPVWICLSCLAWEINLEHTCIQFYIFSALPSCGRVPCTWLHTVHGLPSSLAPPKITVSRPNSLWRRMA